MSHKESITSLVHIESNMPEGCATKIALHVRSEPAGEQVLKRTAFSLPAGRQVGYFFVAPDKEVTNVTHIIQGSCLKNKPAISSTN